MSASWSIGGVSLCRGKGCQLAGVLGGVSCAEVRDVS